MTHARLCDVALLTATLSLVLSCTDGERPGPLGPGAPPAEVVHLSADPSTPPAGAVVVGTLADAFARVTAGGTVLIYDGTYPVEFLVIDRPVTFQPAPGATPLIRAIEIDGDTPTRSGFVVHDLPSGTVTFRDLSFEGVDRFAIIRTGQTAHDQVLIENNVFVAGGTTAAAIFVQDGGSPTALFTIRNNTFTGGDAGVFVAGGHAHIIGNTFSGHTFSAVQMQGGPRGRVEGNTLSECGPNGCIRVFDPLGVEIVGNTVRNSAGRAVNFGIVAVAPAAGDFEVLIENNVVEGLGTTGTDYAFGHAGIALGDNIDATVRGNTVSNAATGISVSYAVSALVAANTVDPCGAECVAVFQSGNDVRVIGNTLRAHRARQTTFGVMAVWRAGSGTLRIEDNLVLGVETPASPADPADYPVVSGIQVAAWVPEQSGTGQPAGAPVTVRGNTIRNAHQGVAGFHGGVIRGERNDIESVHSAWVSYDGADVVDNHSDAVGYQVALNGGRGGHVDASALDVSCNWWGTTSGPTNVLGEAGFLTVTYTPWATEPVANTGSTSCDGVPAPEPAEVAIVSGDAWTPAAVLNPFGPGAP